MHRAPFVAVVIVLACAACSRETAKAPPTPAEAASTPAVAEPPPPASQAATTTEPAVSPPPEPASQTVPVAASPPPERVVRVVPAKERRIHALINNAIARDVTGHTEDAAAMWESRRAGCKTQACVDRAYAAQESELRKWEGSEAVR